MEDRNSVGFRPVNSDENPVHEKGIILSSPNGLESKFENSRIEIENSDKRLSEATYGHKKGNWVALYSEHDEVVGRGRLLGIEESTGAIIIARPRRYTLNREGFKEEYNEEITRIGLGRVQKVIDSSEEECKSFMSKISLMEGLGKEIIVQQPASDSFIMGRLDSVHFQCAYLNPVAMQPNPFTDLWRVVYDPKFRIHSDSSILEYSPLSVEDFVRERNQGIIYDLKEEIRLLYKKDPSNEELTKKVKEKLGNIPKNSMLEGLL